MTDACRCALCGLQRRSFHCGGCVRRGDFMHSAATPERFAEKQSKLMEKKAICKEIEKSWSRSAHFRAYTKKENISIDINSLKQRIAILSLAVEQKQDKLIKCRDVLKDLHTANKLLQKNMPDWEKSVDIIRGEAENKFNAMQDLENNLTSKLRILHLFRISRLNQLVNNVFPIQILTSLEKGGEIHTEQAIAEALQPFTNSEKTKLLPIQILTITLPADGDYTAYCHWVSSYKRSMISHNSSINPEIISRNQAYRLSAGLAYSTQLLLNIAYYLDIKLPYNINYGDFCSSELEERKFKNLVKKLHLCAAVILNRVNLSKIIPKVGKVVQEPPLHILLKLCPLRPILYIEDYDADYIYRDKSSYFASSWLDGIDKECLQLTSDDEEPVCINWDPEIAPAEVVMSSSPKGFSESILSMFRVWK